MLISEQTYTLPSRKAAPMPQSPGSEGSPSSRNTELHSPLSPLSPGSPIFPDGLFTPLWFNKHQQQVPCLYLAFFDIDSGDSRSQDEQIKSDISALRNALSRSGFKTRFAAVLLGDKSILHAPEFEERLGSIRRATGLDLKTGIFFMPPMSSQGEVTGFVQSTMTALQPTLFEYYRELTKHARRKKAKGGPAAQTSLSSSSWNVRYEIKQGVFAEFRQEMDVAERHYTAAIEELFGSESIFETSPCWSPKWDQTRLICDAMAIRILRCLLWAELNTSAAQSWSNYKSRTRSLMDRRGKGSQDYGWDAWEARWAGIMSELIQRANISSISKPPKQDVDEDSEPMVSVVYAEPEKIPSPVARMMPFTFLHHPGYWLMLCVRGWKSRWDKVSAIPEGDRIPPSQSPASAVVDQLKNYDTYLAFKPYEENPLSGDGKIDYLSRISEIYTEAGDEFEARKQNRMLHRIRVQLAQDLINYGRCPDATDILLQLWRDSTWREEDWLVIFGQLLRLLYQCISQNKSQDSAELMPTLTWELLSLAPVDMPEHSIDLGLCLDDWDVNERISLNFQNKERLSPVSIAFAFSQGEGYVGELIECQLTLEYRTSEASKPIEISQVELQLGSSITVTLRHKPSEQSQRESSLSFNTLELDVQEGGSATTDSDLRLAPSQKRILNFSLTLREAQILEIIQASVCVEAEKFILTHCFTDLAIRTSSRWYAEENGVVGSVLLPRIETTSINVLPKPPKIRILLHGIRKEYYTSERIRLSVELINEEVEAVSAKVVSKILGQNDETLPTKWADGDGSSQESITLEIEPSAANKKILLLQGPSDASAYTLNIDVGYVLISEPNTSLSKSRDMQLTFAAPFEAKFTFNPVLNEVDRWPSYFDPLTEESKDFPEGIAQRWKLGSQVKSLASSNLKLKEVEIRIDNVKGDATCNIISTSPGAEETISPARTKSFISDVLTRKFSLDDRRPTNLDLFLDLTWAYGENVDYATTEIAIPRLAIQQSEPRVLCTVTKEGLFGADAVLQYHLENPSGHFLTFALTMEASEYFAFSGPKYRTFSLGPLSRHRVDYRVMIHSNDDKASSSDVGIWVSPPLQVIDSYYQKTLKVQPAGPGVELDEKREIRVWIDKKTPEE